MSKIADGMSKKPEIESKRMDESQVRKVKTTDLSKRFDMSIPVKQSLLEIQMEDDEEITMGRRKFH